MSNDARSRPSTAPRIVMAALFVSGIALGLMFATSRTPVFANTEALIEHFGAGEWVRLGGFNESWPAKMVDSRDERGAISFEHRGTKHSYEKFDGYVLKWVSLEDPDGGKVTIVLRSAKPTTMKTADSADEQDTLEPGVRR